MILYQIADQANMKVKHLILSLDLLPMMMSILHLLLKLKNCITSWYLPRKKHSVT